MFFIEARNDKCDNATSNKLSILPLISCKYFYFKYYIRKLNQAELNNLKFYFGKNFYDFFIQIFQIFFSFNLHNKNCLVRISSSFQLS